MPGEETYDNPASLPELKLIEEKKRTHDAKVAALNAALQALSDESRQLDEERNALMPFSKLPLEVKTKIFILACKGLPISYKWKIPPAFVIGSVCRAWRNMAWSTPELWTDISVALSLNGGASQMILLQEWLDRSAPRNLKVDLRRFHSVPGRLSHSSDDSDDSSAAEPPSNIFRLLLSTCHRWEELQLFAFHNFFVAMEQTPLLRFDSLKSLRIHSRPPQSQSPQGGPGWVFKLHQPLNTLHLEIVLTRQNLDINWAALQNLNAIFRYEDCASVLRDCEALICCKLTIPLAHILQPSVDKIRLPNLKSLTLHGQEQAVALLMGALETPVLTDLAVRVSYQHLVSVWRAALTSMIKQSPFPLTSLSLSVDDVHPAAQTGDENIMPLLRPLRNIESLDLSFGASYFLTNAVLDQLSLRPSNRHQLETVCFPQLRSFKFRGQVSFDLEFLIRTLKSRLGPSSAEAPGNTKPGTPAKFTMGINYTNESWFTDKRPNEIHGFYKKLMRLSPAIELDLSYGNQ